MTQLSDANVALLINEAHTVVRQTTTKTVLVTPQLPIAYESGGIGTFIGHFAHLLRQQGEDVHIILTTPPQKPDKEWRPQFDKQGISVHSVYEYETPLDIPVGYRWHTRIAELAADAIPDDTDVVYFADWCANGAHYVRRRRFQEKKLPIVVTVLHGNSKWNQQGAREWPSSFDEMALHYLEGYTAEHSDYVVAPSQYILDWAAQNNWKLPSSERVRVLNYPFFPRPRLTKSSATTQVATAKEFKRIIFFSRVDMRKGIDLFVNALLKLADRVCMKPIEEVVLLGSAGQNIYGEPNVIARLLQSALSNVQVRTLSTLSSVQAQSYLVDHASDSLVVVPSRSETLGFAVIEASLIPGLNLICSNAGAIPEIFGAENTDHLFEPFQDSVTRKIEEQLLAGPHSPEHLASYDWQSRNNLWLDFHHEMRTAAWSAREAVGEKIAQHSLSATSLTRTKSCDVVMPFYNLGRYLPFALQALAEQTTDDFNLFVVNDGSTDANSVQVFEESRRKYANRDGWRFVTSSNQGVCVARNFAASLGNAEYICFVDADNISAPNMVERFVQGMRLSGEDCLTCNMYSFIGEGGYHGSNGLLRPANYHYVPIGNAPALGAVDNPFGDGNCIMRRSVFEALGGFTLDYPKQVNHEDRELLTRISLSGYSLDVVPEFLFFYRHRKDSRLRTTETYLNDGRVLRHYEERLRSVGLADLAPYVLGMTYRIRDMGSATMFGGAVSINHIVHQVSGYTVLKALVYKVRNQVLRRLGRPLKP